MATKAIDVLNAVLESLTVNFSNLAMHSNTNTTSQAQVQSLLVKETEIIRNHVGDLMRCFTSKKKKKKIIANLLVEKQNF